MTRIDDIFAKRCAEGRRALMPFLCAGRPSLETLPDLLKAMERSGASIVEIGIPFSDPIADGPVIAAAMHKALADGVTPARVLEAVRSARPSTELGLVAMVSVSIVHRTGLDRFTREAQGAGFDGLIVPDAPIEEAAPIRAAADAAGLSLSLLVAPTTSPTRARSIVEACTGFVYLLARTGITGERDDAPDIADAVNRLRDLTDLPIACGFGISTADQVRTVVQHADAAIVGSALVRRIETALDEGDDPIEAAETFVRGLAAGLGAPVA